MSPKHTRRDQSLDLFSSGAQHGASGAHSDLLAHAHGGDRNRPPLADRMRPQSLDEYIGQRHVLAPGKLLRRAIEADQVRSLILYGPPGTGKTTLAQVIAHHSRSTFRQLNAVLAGVKVLREEVEGAQRRRDRFGQATLLFIDEIHRFNQAQQDALLPWVERGVITLIGATTENPYFEVNAALNSRSHIFQLKALDEIDLIEVATRALTDEVRGLGAKRVVLEPHALAHWVGVVDGDARALLNALELAVETTPLTSLTNEPNSISEVARETRALLGLSPKSTQDLPRSNLSSDASQAQPEDLHVATSSDQDQAQAGEALMWRVITLEVAEASIQERAVRYDAHGDQHFDTISAYIKSLRGSDPDAALYWLAKMVYAGEPARAIFRRLLIFASEDVGLAWSEGLAVVNACAQAFDRVGMPEGRFHLAHATLAMATAPKSNSVMGFFDALESVAREGAGEVPTHLKDSHRDGEALGHGAGYLYPHAYQNHWVAQQHLPSALVGRVFYEPSQEGEERALGARVHRLREAQLECVAQPEVHPVIEMSDPDEARVDEWAKRAEGTATLRWSQARDELLKHAQLARASVTLDLNAGAGLLTWSAVRQCVEGGVYSWCQTLREAEQLNAQAGALPWAHRPTVGSGDWEALGRWPLLSEVSFDRVIGRDILRDPRDWSSRLTWILSQMSRGGLVALSERHPQRAQRLSALKWPRPLNPDISQRWREAEEHLYTSAGDDDMHLLWRDDLLSSRCHELAESVGLEVQLHRHELSWRARLTAREVERWCDLERPRSYLTQLVHADSSFTLEDAHHISSSLRAQVGSWLTWREERLVIVFT